MARQAFPGARDPDALLLVGRILRAHGVRGEVKLVPETDDPARFSALETVFVGAGPDAARPYAVAAVRFQPTRRGTLVVLKLHGIDGREAAEALRKAAVFARESDLPPLAGDEVFLHDLVGLRVETEDGAPVGVVKDVLEMPAHEVLLVARPGRPDVMVPAVDAFVAEIDLAAGRLVIRPIEGLLE